MLVLLARNNSASAAMSPIPARINAYSLIVCPASGLALDVERTAEHAHALSDADEAEATALRGLRERALDLEAGAVVDDLNVDRAAAGAQPHFDRPCAGMLAYIRERLLDRAEDGDALRGRERVRVAADFQRTFDPGAVREVVDFAMQGLAERPAED